MTRQDTQNTQPNIQMSPDQAAAALAFVTKISQDRNSQANQEWQTFQKVFSEQPSEQTQVETK